MLKFAFAVLAAYLFFKISSFFGLPVPANLLRLYMLFAVIMILLVMTTDDKGASALFRPFAALFTDRSKVALRIIVFACVPLLSAYLTYSSLGASSAPPAEPRTIHPAPPAVFSAYGKAFNAATLENPFRETEVKDPARFKELVKEGGAVYFKNCFFCHGAKLDGKGHYAGAFNPRPLPFTAGDTIAQLQEGYVFWRIVKGGPGLPREGSPWASSMPAWEASLSEDDVWKAVLFIYDYTGNSPRSWGLRGPKAAVTKREAAVRAVPRGKEIYDKRCAWCHGINGDGMGPAATYLNPAPRDFTLGFFKWKTTPFDEFSPSAEDLVRMISRGAGGTSMPGWSDVLSKAEIKDVAEYVRALGRFEYSQKSAVSAVRVSSSKEATERGKKLFLDRCSECHGEEGRGNGAKKLKDDWGGRTWPRDLTKGWTFRSGKSANDIYVRITAGIAGTQMPSFADAKSRKMLSEDERRDVAAYAESLQEPDREPGATDVVRARPVEGPLPETADDGLWAKAPWAPFGLAPQIIAGEKLYKPVFESVSVKALYSGKEIAFLVEWEDPTLSLPGDAKADELAEGTVFPDSAALEFALPGRGARPYFGMGDANAPVVIWQWKSPASVKEAGTTRFLFAKGHEKAEETDAARSGLTANGAYRNGRWRVVMKGPLKAEDGLIGASFSEGVFAPIAVALWDGSNGERGSRHTMTPWKTLILEREGAGVYLWPLMAAVIALAAELIVYGLATGGRKG